MQTIIYGFVPIRIRICKLPSTLLKTLNVMLMFTAFALKGCDLESIESDPTTASG
jgi:hypothetical protein